MGRLRTWSRRSCSDGSSAIPMRFLTLGRSLWVTGFVVASPHLIARANAEDTKPAMFLTVFGFIGRGVLLLACVAAAFQQPRPLTTEMKGRNLGHVHREQLWRDICNHLAIPLYSFRSQVFMGVLSHELCQEHRQSRRHGRGHPGSSGLTHHFLSAACRFGGCRLLLRREPGLGNKILIFACRSEGGELVIPYRLPRSVFSFVDRHSVTSRYARFSI